ncbi:hypothetical protein PISMIDRAFT_680813, partial [Pisolithus microcarpus 441]
LEPDLVGSIPVTLDFVEVTLGQKWSTSPYHLTGLLPAGNKCCFTSCEPYPDSQDL